MFKFLGATVVLAYAGMSQQKLLKFIRLDDHLA
jgi:hypothetical protein